jgi:Pseudomonas avirulence D protein (AvrD)
VLRPALHTLWMLKTTLEAESPDRPANGPHATGVSITGKQLLPLRGATWRSVDLTGGCAGISLKSTFAHQLPASVAAVAS